MEKPTLTEEEKKALSKNIDALYIYMDTFMDEMTQDEIDAWGKILKELDPEFEKIEEDD